MNGFVRKTVAAACLGSGAVSLLGCASYRELVDPCYPERYNLEARKVTNDVFDTQAHNGHVLDQTIWNYDFERDERNLPTDKLNGLGQQKLRYIVQRRPCPDGKLYLQTAVDVYVPLAEIETLSGRRQELDSRRIQSIQRYLNAQMAGRNHAVAWDVCIHDALEVGQPSPMAGGAVGAVSVIGSYPKYQGSFNGSLSGASGSTGAATGGAVGGPTTAAGPAQPGIGSGSSSAAPGN